MARKLARSILGGLAALGMGALPALAQQTVKLGVLTDMAGPASSLYGPGSVTAAKLAIEDMGGSVNGQKIELIFADHQNKTDLGAGIARQWIAEQNVDVFLDVTGSAIGLAVQPLVAAAGKMALYSGVSTDVITEAQCAANTVQWSWNTYALINMHMRALVGQGFDSWYVLWPDYAYGQQVIQMYREGLPKLGAKLLGDRVFPVGTQDFASYLLAAQQTKAKLVVDAQNDNTLPIFVRQGAEFGLPASGQALSGSWVLLNNVHSMGDQGKGMLTGESWYWDMDDQNRSFASRFRAERGVPPNSAQASVYSSALQYLRAVKAAGNKEPAKVRAEMAKGTLNDVFLRNGKLLDNGLMIHDMYLVKVRGKADMKGDWDHYDVVATVPGAQAFRPISESACPMLKKG